MSSRIASGVRIVLAMLREVFDESAYARFLLRSGDVASRASYAAFLHERQDAQERRPRCC